MKSIELFCGCGGLALGLQNAGFKHSALYEWNKASCNTITENISSGYNIVKNWAVHHTDVREVCFQDFKDKIQLVSGGPPCQPFSLGGKHLAHNDCRDMFPEAVRAVREIRPKAFIFENVKGLLRKSFSGYFNYILLQLQYPEIIKSLDMNWIEHLSKLEQHHTSSNKQEGLNYNLVFRLVNAADFGVPQTRQRVIIVGFRSDVHANWSYPATTHSRSQLLYSQWIAQDYWDKHCIKKPKNIPLSPNQLQKIEREVKNSVKSYLPWTTVRDAFKDLPDPKNDLFSRLIHNHEYRAGAKIYKGHSGSIMDAPSKTLKAGVHGVPGGENMFIQDNGDVRYYTVRESARLQTFPDSYIFNGTWSESMRQIGNAVPVKLAQSIGSEILQHLK